MTAATPAKSDLRLIVLLPPKMPAALGAPAFPAGFCRVPPGGTGRRPIAIASTIFPCAAAHPLARAEEALEQHGGDDDRADRRALPVGVDVEEVEAVADQHHDQHADEG